MKQAHLSVIRLVSVSLILLTINLGAGTASISYTQAIPASINKYIYVFDKNVFINRNEAIKDISQVIQSNPDYALAYYMRGTIRTSIYARGGGRDLKGAIKDISQAIEINPNYDAALYKRAALYQEIGDSRRAAEDYVQILQLIPSSSETYDRKALENYKQLIQTSPDFSAAYYHGLVLLLFFSNFELSTEFAPLPDGDLFSMSRLTHGIAKDKERLNSSALSIRHAARGFFDEAIKLKPNFSNAYYFRGRSSHTLETAFSISVANKEAIEDYSKAIKLDSTLTEACYHRALAFIDSVKRLNDFKNRNLYVPLSTEFYKNGKFDVSLLAEFYKNKDKISGYTELAIQDLIKFVGLNPRFTNAFYKLGEAYSLQGDDQKASENYLMALKSAPLQERAKEYIEVLQVTPNNATDYYRRGLARKDLGDKTGAIRDFTKAISLDPTLAEAYLYRAVTYKYLHDSSRPQKEIKDYTKAIQLDSSLAEAYYYRGRAYKNSGNTQKALKDLDQAITLNPRLVGAYLYRGLYSGLEKQVSNYLEVVRINPDFIIEAQEYLGSSKEEKVPYFRRKHNENLIQEHTIALNKDSRSADVYADRGLVYLDLGNIKEAIADFTSAIALRPEDEDNYYYRGVANYQQKKIENSIEDFTAAIKIKSDFVSAYRRRALAYLDQGNYHKAVEDATRAIDLDPTDYAVFLIRGSAYKKIGDSEKYSADINKVSELLSCGFAGEGCLTSGSSIPTASASTYYNKGRKLANKGDIKAAIMNLQQAANIFLASGEKRSYTETTSLISNLRNRR